ncbi:MAG: NhaD family Na+:H+ antiporter [Chlamydiales bacterium]
MVATWITLLFFLGYLCIILDHVFKIDKTAIALLTGVGCWIAYFAFFATPMDEKLLHLNSHLADISQIIFFLMGAMLIVEVIDAHKGLDVLGDYIAFKSPKAVLWATLFLAFFMSALLDNLTTMIVFICLLRKVIPSLKERLIYLAAVVVAANIGGVWTPIGDVTTTMLWIGDRITPIAIIQSLFLPCLVSLATLGTLVSFKLGPDVHTQKYLREADKILGRKRVLVVGLSTFLVAPILKMAIDLPPFLGIMFGVAILWVMTDLMHYRDPKREHLRVFHVLGRIDLSSVLFFLGILLAVDSLEVSGVLNDVVGWIESVTKNAIVITGSIGIVSSVLDNVPLVAACMRMYPLEVFGTNHYFWNLIAYCAGTGGSILIIGSAPGIALMSMEKVSFAWYLKHMSWISLICYLVGLGVFIALS